MLAPAPAHPIGRSRHFDRVEPLGDLGASGTTRGTATRPRCRLPLDPRGAPMSSQFPDRTARSRRRIGVLLFDGVEELDAVGPWEVLASWTREHPEDGWDVSCFSPAGRDVLGANGLVIGA